MSSKGLPPSPHLGWKAWKESIRGVGEGQREKTDAPPTSSVGGIRGMGLVNRPESPSLGPRPSTPLQMAKPQRSSFCSDYPEQVTRGEGDRLVTGSHSDRNPNTASLSHRLTSQPTLSMLAVSFLYKPVVVIGSHVAILPSAPPHLCPSKESEEGDRILHWESTSCLGVSPST